MLLTHPLEAGTSDMVCTNSNDVVTSADVQAAATSGSVASAATAQRRQGSSRRAAAAADKAALLEAVLLHRWFRPQWRRGVHHGVLPDFRRLAGG
jgi:hypothetical protein